MEPGKLAAFYTDHLKRVLLPFWLENGIDREHGGFFTCFSNDGKRLVSTDKYTWSQGRMVWALAKLAESGLFTKEERASLLRLARSGARFLMEHCLLENGNCSFLMSRDGVPKPQQPGGRCDTSIYADGFVVLGLSRYAAASGDDTALLFVNNLYRSVVDRMDRGDYLTEPYPRIKGYRNQGLPMFLLNVSQELARAMERLGDPDAAGADSRADRCMREVLDGFVDEECALHEFVCEDGSFESDTLLGRYVNPGHTVECMWFVLHQALKHGHHDVLPIAFQIAKKAFENGWDTEFGGLYLFADCRGGPPEGGVAGVENETMVRKVQNDWAAKLWWPHSEALYTSLLCHSLSGDAEFLEWYDRIADYTFRTFPNPDAETGEWIQIRDRQGRPEERVVALPVKDPFHIIRNVLLILDLLRGDGPEL